MNSPIKNIAIIIGAEGGFDPKEAELISSINSVKAVGLGERILRAETAAINLTSILMYEFDS
ncbi:16S ribosomal RNA methyltransferase RsmE [compost metagenome]